MIGTFDYAAPEQLREAPVDARTDVYALGAVLYQAITGKVPYPRETAAATMLAHLDSPPPSVLSVLPDASELLGEVVRRAMAKQPDDRYPSAGDLGRAARAAVGQIAVPVTERSVAEGDASPRIAPAVPLPPALAVETGRGPFVGREELLERLAARFSIAVSGERQFVLLAGDPGIGKTRLAAEFARRADATVLYGRSDPEALLPYQPFITALAHFVSHRETLVLPREIAGELTELSRFVPELRRHVPEFRRDAQRRAGDAPLPAVRGRQPDARVRRARAPGRAAARRSALGRRVDAAAARPPAPGRRADAAAGRRHRADVRR